MATRGRMAARTRTPTPRRSGIPCESYRVNEKTTSLYVQADLGGERWSADVGVRFGKTRTSAQAWDAEILSITENGPFNFTAEYADPTPVTQDGDYTFVLPSANLAWKFTDERAAATRTRQDHGAPTGGHARAHQHHRKHLLGVSSRRSMAATST